MTNSTENVAKNVANEKVQDYVKKSHITTENEPKSEKTTQDVQKNCSSLTEKWKKAKLEQGYYYTKYTPKVGKPFVEIELRNYLLDLAKVRDADTVKILAPVPSYETYLTMKDCAKMVFEAAERETKLKELLKECRDLMNRAGYVFAKIEDVEKARNLLNKIDEVLK